MQNMSDSFREEKKDTVFRVDVNKLWAIYFTEHIITILKQAYIVVIIIDILQTLEKRIQRS